MSATGEDPEDLDRFLYGDEGTEGTQSPVLISIAPLVVVSTETTTKEELAGEQEPVDRIEQAEPPVIEDDEKEEEGQSQGEEEDEEDIEIVFGGTESANEPVKYTTQPMCSRDVMVTE